MVEQHLDKILRLEIESMIVYRSNSYERVMDHHHRGKCVGAIVRVLTYYSAHGMDPSRLGLLSSIVLIGK